MEIQSAAHGTSDHLETPARLSFLDCTYMRMEVDVEFKRMVSDAISYSECLSESSFRREVEERMQYETAPLDPYWEFVIHLCPPAGELRIFARDFILQVLEREIS